jgi:hypothetical protein
MGTPATSKTIDFDAERHMYTVAGHPRPSVTQILTAAGLIDDAWYTIEARARGHAVHVACHYLDEGDLDPAWLESSPFAGYVRSYQRFVADVGFVCDRIEERLFNATHGYCGTCDRTGLFRGCDPANPNVLLDLKTGGNEAWHRVQLAAYAACQPDPGRFRRFNVYLSRDGSRARLTERTPGMYLADWNVFQAAVVIANFKGWTDGSGQQHR